MNDLASEFAVWARKQWPYEWSPQAEGFIARVSAGAARMVEAAVDVESFNHAVEPRHQKSPNDAAVQALREEPQNEQERKP